MKSPSHLSPLRFPGAGEGRSNAVVKQKSDLSYVAAARELRDRSLEQMNAGLLLPPAAQGKEDVSRALEVGVTTHSRNAENAEPPDPFRLFQAT
jgi:hypothetical protein